MLPHDLTSTFTLKRLQTIKQYSRQMHPKHLAAINALEMNIAMDLLAVKATNVCCDGRKPYDSPSVLCWLITHLEQSSTVMKHCQLPSSILDYHQGSLSITNHQPVTIFTKHQLTFCFQCACWAITKNRLTLRTVKKHHEPSSKQCLLN